LFNGKASLALHRHEIHLFNYVWYFHQYEIFIIRRKLNGARYFYKGYEAKFHVKLSESLLSARDNEGHGSHILPKTGGSFVPGANVFGIGNGTSYGSSKARVATCKVCWQVLPRSVVDVLMQTLWLLLRQP